MWLDQIQDASAFVEKNTANAKMDDYASDRQLRQATERSLQIIGDALLRLERADPESARRLPGYRAVIDLRKGLSYGYESPATEHVWEVIQDVLPVLHREAVKLLREAETTTNAVGRQSDDRVSDGAQQETCLDNPVIAEHLEGIRALCREYGVLRLEAFGSVCTPDFDPGRSDVDFLVEYPEDYDFGPWASRLTALQEALANLLGREVDLVMTRAIRKKYFLQSVNETREVLYAA